VTAEANVLAESEENAAERDKGSAALSSVVAVLLTTPK
jgi:hypothetical protein